MSEEKLYVVKNDEGKYWDFKDYDGFYSPTVVLRILTNDQKEANKVVRENGGHVVTLIEEPKKVVISKEQAEIVEKARISRYPASNISIPVYSSGDEKLLIQAFVNGYTVAKEKKYNVKVPHTDDSYFYKVDDEYCNAGDSYYLEGMTDKKWFTDAEIEHYGLGDCEKVWCDSDDE